MADNYKVTAYNNTTGQAQITFNLDARTNFPALVNASVPVAGCPVTGTATDVDRFLRAYADAYIAGKQAEAIKQSAPSAEVAALLGVTRNF